MASLSPYDEAQLLMAAIRIHEFTKKVSPSFQEAAELLHMTSDWISRVCAELSDKGVVDIVEGPFQSTCVTLKDPLAAESLSRGERVNRMEEELKKFKEKNSGAYEKKVKAMQKEQKQKEKDLFNDIASRLKNELGGKGK